jgi:hypothetical protein
MNGKWWREWKGPVAAILGLTVAAGKFAVGLKAAAGGVFIEYKLGLMSLKVAAGVAKTSALVTAAGSAVLLGAGVAAAVYFVPWDDVFSWIWDWICNLWASFRKWASKQAERLKARNQNIRDGRSVPMAFS